jgi:hypothetical protein
LGLACLSLYALCALLLLLAGASARAAAPSAKASKTEPAPDASVIPRYRFPSIVDGPSLPHGKPARGTESTAGWSRALLHPGFEDRTRRIPRVGRPHPFGHTLLPGERFKFDVSFAGNPAGLAEAEVVGYEQDPRGGPPLGRPMLRLEGHARTSGIVSLLATVTDDLTTIIDADSGAAVSSHNILRYSGWAPGRYKLRVTDATYEGRGSVRVIDTKDGKAKTKVMRVPIDTFDPLSAMAWVRSLELSEGDRAKAHAIDGTTLLRIEIECKGPGEPAILPSITSALELGPEGITLLEGTLTRVDRYDQAIPGKRVYKMRAWVTNDVRRIPLLLESDMWVGAVRLELSAYDPPPRQPTGVPGSAPKDARFVPNAGGAGAQPRKTAP